MVVPLFVLSLMAATDPGGVPTDQPVSQAAVVADPTRLPGDEPPPPLARMLRLPSGRPTGLAGPPPDVTPGPSLGLALEAAQAALDACKADHLLVGVAVLDSAGQLRLGMVADGAAPGRIYGAAQKAVAAIAFGEPTSAVQEKLRADPSATARLRPNMSVLPGGVPLIVGRRVIGAIAASGATAQQDEACAAAGAAKIKAKLE